MTHDFIHTSLYCRFERLLIENVKKGSPLSLENANFASFSTKRYDGVLWKTHFFGTTLLHKFFYSEKRVTIFFFQKLIQYGSMIEVYIKAKI